MNYLLANLFGNALKMLDVIVWHMSPEIRTIEVEPVDEIPDHATVRHYDQLDEEIKDRFPEFVTDKALSRIDQDAGAAFGNCDCEVVKFTNYYHIVRGEC